MISELILNVPLQLSLFNKNIEELTNTLALTYDTIVYNNNYA